MSTANTKELETTASEPSGRPTWLADGLLALTACMWGINILVFKYSIRDVDPYTFNAQRLVFALLTLVTLAGAESIFWPKQRIDGKIPWPQVLVYSFFSGVLYLLSLVSGISNTTAGNVALGLATMPVWTALLSRLLLSERFPALSWLGLLVTLIGTVIVTTQGSGGVNLGSQYLVGNLWVLASAIAWASATLVSRSILGILTPLQLAAISAALTTPIHLWIAADDLPAAFSQLSRPSYLAAVVYCGAFSTGIAYATWNAGVRLVGASHASVYQNVVTLVAVLGSWLFLSEPILAAQIFGGGLTIAGLLLMRRGRQTTNSLAQRQ